MPQRNGNYNNVYRGLYGGDKNGLYRPGANGARNPMIYGKPQRPQWPKFVLGLVILVIVVLVVRQFACSAGGTEEQETSQAEQSQQAEQVSSAQTQAAVSTIDGSVNGVYTDGLNATIQISAIGDCTLGTDADLPEDTNFTKIYKDVGSPDYFFKNVRRFLNDDQVTICNFEGALTGSDDPAEGKLYTFKGPSKYAKILTEGSVEAANLANNHSYDYNAEGYEDTKKALTKAKIVNFGFDRTATYSSQGILIGLFGINCVEKEYEDVLDLVKQDIQELQEEECALIVGCFHWGEEGEVPVTDFQVKLAHAAIDEGCDLVLGAHPHVLQGVELYENRYICYSLGNFCFGGNDNPAEFDTMIFQQNFTFENGQLVLTEENLKDACMVPCTVSSSAQVNNYQPTPRTGKQAKSIIKKVNERSKALKGDPVQFKTKLNDEDRAVVK